jgi:hypothetical protein
MQEAVAPEGEAAPEAPEDAADDEDGDAPAQDVT